MTTHRRSFVCINGPQSSEARNVRRDHLRYCSIPAPLKGRSHKTVVRVGIFKFQNPMFHKLVFFCSLLIVTITLQSCSSGGDTVGTTPTDTTKHAAGYFSNMSVSISWVVGYPMIVQLTIDSAGRPLSVLPGDTVWYIANTRRYGVRRYDTLWKDALQEEVIDSGEYEFHVQRHVGPDTLSATFSLPVIPFRITAPKPGSFVSRAGHINDTIVYQPAGGREVWILYLDENERPSQWFENSYPDDGRYIFAVDGFSNGYAQLLRHFIGDISSPGPFKAVHYDYWEGSKHLALRF